jgi:hypothetical protein
MEMQSTMPIGFVDSTVHIFTIRFTGTAGIMIPTYTIHFITLHGIRLITAGAGVAAGIRPTTAGAGVIHLITATGTSHIMADFTEVITVDTLIITVGMAPEITGMPIQRITVTDKGVQPEPMYFTEMTMAEEPQFQVCGHQPLPQKAQEQEMLAGQLKMQLPAEIPPA